jgi:hypothetical protein
MNRQSQPARPPLDRVANYPGLPLSPLELTLTRNAPECPHSSGITPLESIRHFAKSFRAHSYGEYVFCPDHRAVTHLESILNLLSPLDRTLTKNAPLSPLELTLTKSLDLKSHRITLLQKRVGRGCGSNFPHRRLAGARAQRSGVQTRHSSLTTRYFSRSGTFPNAKFVFLRWSDRIIVLF